MDQSYFGIGQYFPGGGHAGSFVSASAISPFERLSSIPTSATQHEVLLIAAEPQAAEYAAVLRQTYRVVSTANSEVAKQYLGKGTPSLVIADADGMAEAGDIVRAAKTLLAPPTVLVMATDPQSVPALLQ